MRISSTEIKCRDCGVVTKEFYTTTYCKKCHNARVAQSKARKREAAGMKKYEPRQVSETFGRDASVDLAAALGYPTK